MLLRVAVGGVHVLTPAYVGSVEPAAVIEGDLCALAGLHRTAPGVLEQLVDCSGGDVINEETGFERKAAALLRVLKEQVL